MRVEIRNHFLFIDDFQVKYRPTPNISSYKNKLQYLILHYTATMGISSPLNWLTNPQSKVSAHLLIGKDGTVIQLAPFDRVTWHSGVSQWKGLNGMNAYSLGVEIVNSGVLRKIGNDYYTQDGSAKVPNHIEATNKLGMKAVWETYPDKQIEVVAAVSQALQKHYSLKEIIGHEDVSPKRKTDPGAAFPWDKIRGTSTSVFKTTTTDLNLREKPVNGKAIRVLPKGTTLEIIKEENSWSQTPDGWVSSKYLQ